MGKLYRQKMKHLEKTKLNLEIEILYLDRSIRNAPIKDKPNLKTLRNSAKLRSECVTVIMEKEKRVYEHGESILSTDKEKWMDEVHQLVSDMSGDEFEEFVLSPGIATFKQT